MKEKWIKLLNQLEVFGHKKRVISDEEFQVYEQKNQIILPTEYKAFCQVFGTGSLGDCSMTIYHINDDGFNLIQDLSSHILCFARINQYRHRLFWDLETYSNLDQSCDIYIEEENHTYVNCTTYKIGRNFYDFVRDFCLGMQSYEILPDSMRQDIRFLIRHLHNNIK